MFPQGADAYIDELASVIPIADGSVRTALDTGCGVCFLFPFSCSVSIIITFILPITCYPLVASGNFLGMWGPKMTKVRTSRRLQPL